MKKYALYTNYTETNKTPIKLFEDTWTYSEGEKIFFRSGETKRLFVINHITHDLDEDGNTLHRLYCQEKKAF